MRHRLRPFIVGLAVAAPLLLSACSDNNPTEVSPPDLAPAPSQAAVALGCVPTPTAASLLTMLNQLLPQSPLRASLIALVSSLPQRRQDRIKAAVRRLIFPIQDLLFRAFYAGRLKGGKSAATFDKVLRFSEALHCYVGLTPPVFPTTTAGEDIVVGVVFTNSPTTTLAVPSAHAAVTVPQGAAPGPTTIMVRNLPDSPGPLLTSLDQYPLFYEFSGTTATGPVTFNLDVTAGVCLRDNLGVPSGNLRLAHNVAPFAFGNVEILPLAAAVPGVDCDNLPELGFLNSWDRSFGGSMRQAIEPLVRAVLPAPLHATTLAVVTLKVGGTTKNFSPFGVVDIFSNPGSFVPVGPTESEEESGSTVTRTVRATSGNETPIANVPVTFEAGEGSGTVLTPQPVLTDADGEASASWQLPAAPGNYTLEASVPAIDNSPGGTDDPPAGNVASFPDVAFGPQSVTFTATVPEPTQLAITSGNNQSGFANQILTAPLVVLATQNEAPAQGVPVTFQVTGGGGSITPLATTGPAGLAEANWTLGPTLGVQTATASVPGGSLVTFTATAAQAPPFRVVLQWGTTPNDLDAHLTGPLPPEDRFHVYFGAPCHPGPDTDGATTGCQAVEQAATLDRDDTNGSGPETITVEQQIAGIYRFSVHDFTNRFANTDAPSSALAASGATVTLYLASPATTQVFTVPNLPGTLWTVFELSGSTVTPSNAMGYTSDFATGPFSVLGRAVRAIPTDQAVIRGAIQRSPK